VLHRAPPRTGALLLPFVRSEEIGEERSASEGIREERSTLVGCVVSCCWWFVVRSWSWLVLLLAFVEPSWVPSATLISARGLRLLHAGSSTGTSPTRVTVGRAAPPLTGAALRSTPYLQRAGTPLNCDPLAPISFSGCGGLLIKHLSVCLSVLGPSFK